MSSRSSTALSVAMDCHVGFFLFFACENVEIKGKRDALYSNDNSIVVSFTCLFLFSREEICYGR